MVSPDTNALIFRDPGGNFISPESASFGLGRSILICYPCTKTSFSQALKALLIFDVRVEPITSNVEPLAVIKIPSSVNGNSEAVSLVSSALSSSDSCGRSSLSILFLQEFRTLYVRWRRSFFLFRFTVIATKASAARQEIAAVNCVQPAVKHFHNNRDKAEARPHNR